MKIYIYIYIKKEKITEIIKQKIIIIIIIIIKWKKNEKPGLIPFSFIYFFNFMKGIFVMATLIFFGSLGEILT
jgi:hypothetical protein